MLNQQLLALLNATYDDCKEFITERAAIREIDGRQDRAVAQQAALEDLCAMVVRRYNIYTTAEEIGQALRRVKP